MADAPKILGSDTLRIAYPKINLAIGNSNEALSKATEADSKAVVAVNTANEANTKSDNTQAQLNNLILESGTSDAETIQARTNFRGKQFDILRDRIDDLDVEFKDRGLNVRWFGASGSVKTTTGSITSGSNSLNVSDIIDFEVGQGISIKGAGTGGVSEVASLQITSAATSDGDVIVTLDGVPTNVAVISGDTAIQVADKIRATTFTGWTTGGTQGTDTVTFTANDTGSKQHITYNAGTTGASGTATTVTDGQNGNDLVSKIINISGNVITISDNSAATVSGSIVSHDDTQSIQDSVDQLLLEGGTLHFPSGTYIVSNTINIKKAGKANICIKGSAKSTTIKKSNGDFTVFDFGTTVVPATTYANRIQDVLLDGFTFYSDDNLGRAFRFRNFGRIFVRDIYTIRFAVASEYAGGSELFIRNFDSALAGLGVRFKLDDGLGGSGAGVDMQVVHVFESQFANSSRSVELDNALDVHFHYCIFASAPIYIMGSGSGQFYFNSCHYEWTNSPIIQLLDFSSIRFLNNEFAHLSNTTIYPINVNLSTTRNTRRKIELDKCMQDATTTIVPFVNIQKGDGNLEVDIKNSYPAYYDAIYSRTEEVYYTPKTNLNEVTLNPFFKKGFVSARKTGANLLLSLNNTEKVTGSNSVEMQNVAGVWNIFKVDEVCDTIDQNERIFIDIILKGTNFTSGCLKVILRDKNGVLSPATVIQSSTNTRAFNVQNFSNGFKRYMLWYLVPTGYELDTIQIAKDQNPNVYLYVDSLRIFSQKTAYHLTNNAIPTEGTFSAGERVINTAPSAGGYDGWVYLSNGVWKGYGLIQS